MTFLSILQILKAKSNKYNAGNFSVHASFDQSTEKHINLIETKTVSSPFFSHGSD